MFYSVIFIYAFGIWGLGCNPSYKRCKKIVDELWSNSAKRIFVTISVSRNARFRGVCGEKNIESGIYLLVDFWMRMPRFYFTGRSGIIASNEDASM